MGSRKGLKGGKIQVEENKREEESTSWPAESDSQEGSEAPRTGLVQAFAAG